MKRTAPGGNGRSIGAIKLLLAAVVAVMAAATGIVVGAGNSVADSAPVLANGYGSYDLGQETPFASTTLTAAVPTPSAATTLSFTTIAATSSTQYTFAPIGSVDVTSAACGLDVFDYTAEPYTINVSGRSVSGDTGVTGVTQVAGDPSCSIPSGSTVTQAGSPDQYNVATLIAGGISQVNPASLTIVQQPPATDGFAQVTTTATTGVITMQPESTATGNFSLTYAYCAPGTDLTSDPNGLTDGNCSTGTLTFVQGGALNMGESVSESIETVQEYNPLSFAQVAPATVAAGSQFPWTFIPQSGFADVLQYNSLGNALVNYTDGSKVIIPLPAGVSYVPGSIALSGGDATTSGDATAKYCTAATTGCDAKINSGNYKTNYPYIEEELPTSPTVTGGQLTTLPTVTADFVATGAPGSTPGATLTESAVNTEVQAPILGGLAVAFDGFPAACTSYAATGNYSTTANASGCTATVAYTTPTVVPFTTITPAVTGTSTPNGTDSGPLTGGSTVTVTGSGFTGASQVFFGSTPAASFTVTSDSSLAAVAPAGSANGPVDVTVVSGGQTSPTSGADQFTYTDPTSPDAPTAVVAQPGEASADVSWTAAFDEGSPLTGSTVTATDTTNAGNGGQTCTTPDGSTTGCTVTDLTDGDSYTFTVTATNGLGTGPASGPSAAITVGAPQSPTGVSATNFDNAQSTVSWLPPAVTGSDPPTSYTVTATDSTNAGNGGQTCTYTVVDPETDTCTVTGLTNGDSYTFSVTATNDSGTSPASAPSPAIVPATVPGAPTIGVATAGNAQVSVAFTAPASNGGQPVTGYTVTATDTSNPGSPTNGAMATGTASPVVVTGLTNGDSYTFTVTASNAVGTSAASAASAAATPATTPSAPTAVLAAPDGTTATSADISWAAPANNGGSPVTSYTATRASGGSGTHTCTATAPATSCVITGLTAKTAYTFTVTATNAKGASSASAASNSLTVGVPTAPTNVSATTKSDQATVSWTASQSPAGAISSSKVTASGSGGQTCTVTGTGTSCTVTGLTDGTAYTFTVTSTNTDGTSPASAPSAAVTPQASAPDAPIGVAATATGDAATVTWTAPANDGGSSITGYTVTAADTSNPSDPTNGQTCTTPDGSTTSCTLSGLTDGDGYTFTVTASNALGTGPASAASNSVLIGAPQAPTDVSAVGAENGQSDVSWLPPAVQGDSTVTSYTVTATDTTTPANGGQTCTYTVVTPETDTCTVTGLTNGDTYTFTAVSTNSLGNSPASATSNAIVPSTVPGAPTIGTPTAGNAQVSVAFTAPASNGGSAITGYTVTATDTSNPGSPTNGAMATGTASPVVVTGLTNGDSYTFTVTAGNVSGTGPASAASAATTPATTPSAPTAVLAAPDGTTATSADISWTAPANNGGSPVTSYTATRASGGSGTHTCTATAPATSCVITGLTAKTAYTFTVTATNAKGASSASAASNSLTVGVPTAPTNVSATAQGGQATVSWTASQSPAGAISSSKVTASGSGGQTCTVTGTGTSCTVTGLSDGTAYTFTVTSTNTDGTSPASAASNSVTPSDVPGAPTSVVATAGASSASVSFTAPSANGSAITGYTVTATDTSNPGSPTNGAMATGTGSPITVTGLTNGDSYTFTVTATNGNGTGGASAASNAVTPAQVPDAPTAVSATAGDTQASVSWVPGDDEGSAITSYTVTATDSTNAGNGDQTCTYTVVDPETDTCTVTGLANGDSYTFTVTATNGNGTGVASTASNAVTPSGLPGAPTDASATAGASSASVSFTAPSANGSAITGYTVTATDTTNPSDPSNGATATGTGSPITVTGLTNGDSYTFTVTATNGNGTGGASAASNAVTPAQVPDAPTAVSATAGDTQASVSWVPGDDEGSAITSYTVTATDSTNAGNGDQTCTYTVVDPETDTCTVTGLANGDSYTFTVTATNGNGTGVASTASNAVMPSGLPGAPTDASATAGDAQATVSFTAPSANGSAITGYTVTATDASNPGDGGQSATGAASPITVTGLTDGDSYTFTVVATNGNGDGAASDPSNAVTPTSPSTSNVTFTSPSTDVVVAGKKLNFKATATGTPAALVTVDPTTTLPAWVTATTPKKPGKALKLTGAIPADAGGSFTVTLDGTNSTGTTVQVLTVDVLQFTSPANASLASGTPGTVDVSTTPTPVTPTLVATGVPAGLSFSDHGDGTGTISGTATAPKHGPKTYKVHITATAAGVSVKQVLALTVS